MNHSSLGVRGRLKSAVVKAWEREWRGKRMAIGRRKCSIRSRHITNGAQQYFLYFTKH